MNIDLAEIGRIIRSLRQKQHLTGKELAQKSGLSQSKISKIETGSYSNVQSRDVEQLLNILKAPSAIRQHVARSFEPQTATAQPRIYAFSDFKPEILLAKRCVRLYCLALPSVLQTTPYRIALLDTYGATDKAELMRGAAIMQDMLWSGSQTYTILLAQAALYTRITSRQQHIAQLDRIERSFDLPKVKIGIIPTTAGLVATDAGSFALLDNSVLVVALVQREIHSHDKTDIAIYADTFRHLEHLAVYGDEAVNHIRNAIAHFN